MPTPVLSAPATRYDRTRQLSDDRGIGKGRTQAEQPQARGGDAVWRESIEGLIAVADEDLAQ